MPPKQPVDNLPEHPDTIVDCFDRHYRWGKHWGRILYEVGNDRQKFIASLADDELPQILKWLRDWGASLDTAIERRTPLTNSPE